MKALIFIILAAFFVVALYFNFFVVPPTNIDNDRLAEDTASVDVEEDDDVEDDDDAEDETEDDSEDSRDLESAEEDSDYDTVFRDSELNALYQEKADNNEILHIDIALPPFYNPDELITRLDTLFNDGLIAFTHIPMNASSTNVSSVNVSENSSVVMFNAMQVNDFDIQILHNRTLDNIETVYDRLEDEDYVVYIIGDADIYDNVNLLNTLEEEREYFQDAGYNYIDLNDTAEGLFDTSLNNTTLDNIASAIYEQLTE